MTTLANALLAMIEGTGRGGSFLTTSAGNVGGTTLISTDFKSAALLPTDHLDGVWFNVPSATAPRQARSTTTALGISTGTVTLDVALGSQIGSGVTVRWSPLLPIVAAAATGESPSFESCLYEAMRHLLFTDEVTTAIVADQDSYSLTTWAAHLDRSDRLVAVLEPTPHPARTIPIEMDPDTYELIFDGETPKLRLVAPFAASSGNLTLRVNRPADTWFKVSGTWTETAPGTALAAETDEVKPDLRHCREAGLVFVYQAKAQSTEGPRRAEYQARYEAQLAIARQLPFWDFSRDTLLPRPGGAAQPAQEAA